MKKTRLLVLILVLHLKLVFSQAPFTFEVEQTSIPNAPLLHSFAFAQSGGKWLFIGGRINGLHGIFGSGSFLPKYENKYIWVIDPNTGQVWSQNLFTYLTIAQSDPLRSTNTAYYQDGDKLFIAGGYGLDSLKDSLLTFPTLSAIDVSSTIQAVISGTSFAPYVRQITDERMRVCGAEMSKLGNYMYIPGGHNFWGPYTHTVNNQIYSNRIRKFIITDNGTIVNISGYNESFDTVNYHRRDFNLVPAVRSDGSFGLTLYGGVFRYGSDTPFQNPVYIDNSGYTVDGSFQQKMSQYTSANFEMYDSVYNTMHTTFLGGTSLYRFDTTSNTMVIDTLVPFIKDITTLSRASNGTSTEYIHPYRFPYLIGTNAILIPEPSVPHYDNGVLKLAALTGRTFIGYMFGGMQSPQPNLSVLTTASDKIYKVFVTRNPFGIEHIGTEIPSSFRLAQNYPNPFNPSTTILFDIPKTGFVNIAIYDAMGREIAVLANEQMTPGKYSVEFNANKYSSGVYFYKLYSDGFTDTKKMILIK